MRKLIFGLCCIYIITLCSCEKNGCQTFLQGPWIVKYAADSAKLAIDSVNFFDGDSITEKYKLRYPAPDTGFQYFGSSYFITDNCAEIDFNDTNTWSPFSSTVKYSILLITPNNFEIRSEAASSCDSCVIYFYR